MPKVEFHGPITSCLLLKNIFVFCPFGHKNGEIIILLLTNIFWVTVIFI
jgi:hypothetical protein